MFEKFMVWFSANRKPIGYTVGGMNVLGGVNHALHGDFGLAVLWIVIGGLLIVDAREFK